MPRYLFLHDNDETYVYHNGKKIGGAVEIGYAEGSNPQEAWAAFEAENEWVEEYEISTDCVYSVEIVGEPECLSVEYNHDLWEHVGGPES